MKDYLGLKKKGKKILNIDGTRTIIKNRLTTNRLISKCGESFF